MPQWLFADVAQRPTVVQQLQLHLHQEVAMGFPVLVAYGACELAAHTAADILACACGLAAHTATDILACAYGLAARTAAGILPLLRGRRRRPWREGCRRCSWRWDKVRGGGTPRSRVRGDRVGRPRPRRGDNVAVVGGPRALRGALAIVAASALGR